jgi:hypothetical protein
MRAADDAGHPPRLPARLHSGFRPVPRRESGSSNAPTMPPNTSDQSPRSRSEAASSAAPSPSGQASSNRSPRPRHSASSATRTAGRIHTFKRRRRPDSGSRRRGGRYRTLSSRRARIARSCGRAGRCASRALYSVLCRSLFTLIGPASQRSRSSPSAGSGRRPVTSQRRRRRCGDAQRCGRPGARARRRPRPRSSPSAPTRPSGGSRSARGGTRELERFRGGWSGRRDPRSTAAPARMPAAATRTYRCSE